MKEGKISESVWKRSVQKQLQFKREEIRKGAGVGMDCAVFECSPGTQTVSCMAQTIITSKKSISRVILKCANNIAASGAEPFALLLTLLLPEQAAEAEIREYIKTAEHAGRQLGMQIAGADTAVCPEAGRPVMTVTGFGQAPEASIRTVLEVRPGQDIVVSKWIGLEGTAVLAAAYEAKLRKRYPPWLVEEAIALERYISIADEAAAAVKSNVCAMHDAAEGGIFAALWELAEGTGVGLTVDQKKLPIRQETIEVCEFIGANPYELLSGGSLLMTAEDGGMLAEALAAEGIAASIVGKITNTRDKVILNGEETRFLNRPVTDEIYKFV